MKRLFDIFISVLTSVAITISLVYFIYAFVPLNKIVGNTKLGATITSIALTDTVKSALYTITNTNFTNLNASKLESGSSASTLTIGAGTIGSITTGNVVATSTATSTFAGGVTTVGLSTTKGINVTTGTSTFTNGIVVSGGCVFFSNTCLGATTVSSVSNSDTTLTISPTTGNVVASLNLGKSNVWTAIQNFGYSGTTTASGGFYASLVGAPYFNATSTTATSTFRGGTSMQYATTTNLTIGGECIGCSSGHQIMTSTCTLDGASPSSCSIVLTCPTNKYMLSTSYSDVMGASAVFKYRVSTVIATTSATLTAYGTNGATDVITGYGVCENR